MDIVVTPHAQLRLHERGNRGTTTLADVVDAWDQALPVCSKLVWSLLQRTRHLPSDERHRLTRDGRLLFVAKVDRDRKGAVTKTTLITVMSVEPPHRRPLMEDAMWADEVRNPLQTLDQNSSTCSRSLLDLCLSVKHAPKPGRDGPLYAARCVLRGVAGAVVSLGGSEPARTLRKAALTGSALGMSEAEVELARRLVG